jgi:hypothetical protein
LSCEGRTSATSTLCLVYEDINNEVQCLKLSNGSCSSQCEPNYDPLPSLQGGTCVVAECENRSPSLNGSCYMPGDTTSSRCYSLIQVNRCYSECPPLTTSNISDTNNPKCDPVPCDSRVPDSRGVCWIDTNEACYIYESVCYSQCPNLTAPALGDNVWKIIFIL